MQIKRRLRALRKLMESHQLDAYLIPSGDPHQSEYLADHWQCRAWLTGFTGSAGIAVVTRRHAGLWTDSRYFLQAEGQLSDSEWKLHRQKVPHTPEHILWLQEHLTEGNRVGCDGWLFSKKQINFLGNQLGKKGIILEYDHDLIGPIWNNRPLLPTGPAFELAVEFAGESRYEKLRRVRSKMNELGVATHLISTLDDVAWLFNIRSNADVAFNPVVIAYALIEKEQAYLFIDPRKVGKDLYSALLKDGVEIIPYTDIRHFLASSQDLYPLLVDPNRLNARLYDGLLPESLVHGQTITSSMKARKNEIEIANIKKAMLKDGVALTRLYRWLEASLPQNNVSEAVLAAQLDEFRREQGDCHGESFAAIVGYRSNGAIVHYRPMPGQCATIKNEGLLLIDSGGQYLQGTTDITRTVTLGKPTLEQKRHFTLVLKGHIALAGLKFPEGTRGNQMEIMARQYLWQHGLNYGHGTGHGVGYFLNVHEGPQAFGSGQSAAASTPFVAGMLTSNEPGFYKSGEYGIRTENLLLTVKAVETPYGSFLQFETLSLFPIDLELVEVSMLTKTEREWLNAYHTMVLEKLSTVLTQEEQIWLQARCKML